MDARETDADRAAIAEESEQLRRGLDEERQHNLRLLADLENFRRRAGRDQEVARRDGRRSALLPLLLVLDTLERALDAGSTDPDFYEGLATMAAHGVEPGTVVREIRRGWRLGDELLRPAQVVVASPAEAVHRWR